MRLGYFVVYGDDPHEEIKDAMLIAGCEPEGDRKKKSIYWDRVKKMKDPRPGRVEVLDNLREGDELLIPTLYDLCGSWKHIEYFHTIMKEKGVKVLVGIVEKIEFSGDSAKLMLGFIEKHRKFQTRAGNIKRKENNRGRNAGAPKGPRDKEKAMKAYMLYMDKGEDGKNTYNVIQVCRIIGCAKNTLYKSYIPYAKEQLKK